MFRDTGLTDDSHVAFSYKLGDLDNIKRYLSPGRKMRYKHVELFDAGNLDGDNNIIDPDSPRAHSNRGNMLFHVDSSFNPRRAGLSLLRAVEIPPKGTGGNTDFADSRTAFDELPADLNRELLESNYVGAHTMSHSRKLGSPAFFQDMDPSQSPMSLHHVVQRHEPSGRMNLYVGAHLHHIEGVSPDKSRQLVETLNKHVVQDKYTFTVAWDRPGDMIIWDNRCVQHRATGGTFDGKYKRDMRRTTVHDDGPTAWGLNPVETAMPSFNYNAWGKQPAAAETAPQQVSLKA